MDVGSVPLSETIVSGLPRQAMSAPSNGRCSVHGTPDAGSPHAPRTREPPPSASRRASPFFCCDILQDCVVQHLLGQELLQPRVLVLERLQTAGVGHIHAAILRLELVEGRRADPVLPAHISRLRTGLLFLPHPYDLLFREP